MTAKTLLAIYWQALRLLLKRTPIFNHRPRRSRSGWPLPTPQEAAMKSPSLTVKAHPLAGMGLAAGLLRRTVLHQLYKLRHGQLTLHHGDQQQLFGDWQAR